MLVEGDADPVLHLKESLRFSDQTGYVLQQRTVGVNLGQIFPGNQVFSFLFW